MQADGGYDDVLCNGRMCFEPLCHDRIKPLQGIQRRGALLHLVYQVAHTLGAVAPAKRHQEVNLGLKVLIERAFDYICLFHDLCHRGAREAMFQKQLRCCIEYLPARLRAPVFLGGHETHLK